MGAVATGQPETRALQPRPQQAPGRQPTLHLTPLSGHSRFPRDRLLHRRGFWLPKLVALLRPWTK